MNKVLIIISSLALFIAALHLFLDYGPKQFPSFRYPAREVAVDSLPTSTIEPLQEATSSSTPTTTKKTTPTKTATGTATPAE